MNVQTSSHQAFAGHDLGGFRRGQKLSASMAGQPAALSFTTLIGIAAPVST